MQMNPRNYKNPTVIAWEQLRQMLTQFSDRMKRFDGMAERQGRDIGVDEVFNEIQSIRGQLDQIQSELNLYNNTINTDRVTDMSQPETPFISNKTESRNMNKKLIRLTESDLHRIVRMSVNRILRESTMPNRRGRRRMNEGGHVSYQDEDGVVRTNSTDTYRGVPGSKFIWHGEWSDPEILWDGELINYNEFEDNLWYMFKSETGEDSEEAFEQWIEQEGGTRFLAAELDDYLMCLNN